MANFLLYLNTVLVWGSSTSSAWSILEPALSTDLPSPLSSWWRSALSPGGL